MARRTGSKKELIECEYCGESYSSTYKRCPFCNGDGTGRWDDLDSLEDEDDYDEEEGSRTGGGKRLAGGSRRGGRGAPSVGRIILTIVSLALIIAAVCIVISIVKSMLGGTKPGPAATASPAVESSVPSEAPAESGEILESSAPAESAAPAESQTPTAGQTSGLSTATGFTLNREDFTFDAAGQVFQMKAAFTPEGSTGDITWKSSDPNVAAVSWNGVVTSVASGTATLTASVAGVGEKTCIVRCNFKSGGTTSAATPAPSGSSTALSGASGLKLNREDFTLTKVGESFRMVVSGTSSSVSWASSNKSVATVSADGTVTAVGKGTCNVTATVNGTTLKCIVRCSF